MWSKEFRDQVNGLFKKKSYTMDELLGILENEVDLLKNLKTKSEPFKQRITNILFLIFKIAITNNIDLEQEMVKSIPKTKFSLFREKSSQKKGASYSETRLKAAADNYQRIQWQLSKEEVKELFGS